MEEALDVQGGEMSYRAHIEDFQKFRSVIVPPFPPLGQWKKELIGEVLESKMTQAEAETELKRRIKAWKEWKECTSF